MDDVGDKFAVEVATFEAHRQAWVAGGFEGAWVAIRGASTVGPTVDYQVLWRSAVDALGRPGTFMVKRVTGEERPLVISRLG